MTVLKRKYETDFMSTVKFAKIREIIMKKFVSQIGCFIFKGRDDIDEFLIKFMFFFQFFLHPVVYKF